MWYYYLSALCFILSLAASGFVKARFAKYSKETSITGYTAADAARIMLKANNINDVTIQMVAGSLTDNYNPINKTLNLSQSVYGSRSVAAIAVACHECGHAIQHATGYAPVKIRKTLVPVTNIASNASYVLIMLGLAMQKSSFVTFGAVLFAVIVAFHLVTMPVEIDASKRALVQINQLGLLAGSEISDGKKVLTAAAMTYFVALLSAIVQLLRLLSIASDSKKNNR